MDVHSSWLSTRIFIKNSQVLLKRRGIIVNQKIFNSFWSYDTFETLFWFISRRLTKKKQLVLGFIFNVFSKDFIFFCTKLSLMKTLCCWIFDRNFEDIWIYFIECFSVFLKNNIVECMCMSGSNDFSSLICCAVIFLLFFMIAILVWMLTLSWRTSLSYRNQSVWFWYLFVYAYEENGSGHDGVLSIANYHHKVVWLSTSIKSSVRNGINASNNLIFCK